MDRGGKTARERAPRKAAVAAGHSRSSSDTPATPGGKQALRSLFYLSDLPLCARLPFCVCSSSSVCFLASPSPLPYLSRSFCLPVLTYCLCLAASCLAVLPTWLCIFTCPDSYLSPSVSLSPRPLSITEDHAVSLSTPTIRGRRHRFAFFASKQAQTNTPPPFHFSRTRLFRRVSIGGWSRQTKGLPVGLLARDQLYTRGRASQQHHHQGY